MNTKRAILALTLAALLATPALSHAQTTDPQIQALLQQIQSLLKIVEQLQQQLAQLRGEATNESTPPPAPTAPAGSVAPRPAFCTNLQSVRFGIGHRSPHVTQLQRFLKITGDFTYPEFTSYYGQVTKRAVEKYQCREMGICSGTPSTNGYGLAGPGTRKHMCTTPQPTPSPTPPPNPNPTPAPQPTPTPTPGGGGSDDGNHTGGGGGGSGHIGDGTGGGGDGTDTKITYAWYTSEWNQCTNNQQTRTVICKGSDNNIYPDDKCTSTKPVTTQSCTTAKKSCTFNGQTIQDGESVTAYKQPFVPYYTSCANVSTVRTCTNGVLSGDQNYKLESCRPKTLQHPYIRQFGYYGSAMITKGSGNYIDEVASSANVSWVHADDPDMIAKVSESYSKGLGVILMVQGRFFKYRSLDLRDDYEKRFNETWKALAQYRSVIKGFYVFDEPFHNNGKQGWTDLPEQQVKDNINTVASFLKGIAPNIPTIVVFGGDQRLETSQFFTDLLPEQVDWIGFDCYLTFLSQFGICSTSQVQTFLNNFLTKKYPHQRIVLVPDAVWRNTYPTSDIDRQVAERLKLYLDFADTHWQVIAIYPFLYQNSSILYGAESLPITRDMIRSYFAKLFRH